MGKLKRKFERKKIQKEKKAAQKEIKNKIASFYKRPDNCSLCNAPFDKQSKVYHMTWQVMVYPEAVLLFCPKCAKEKLIKNEVK